MFFVKLQQLLCLFTSSTQQAGVACFLPPLPPAPCFLVKSIVSACKGAHWAAVRRMHPRKIGLQPFGGTHSTESRERVELFLCHSSPRTPLLSLRIVCCCCWCTAATGGFLSSLKNMIISPAPAEPSPAPAPVPTPEEGDQLHINCSMFTLGFTFAVCPQPVAVT